jgi:glycosyltransferase involved in cell wall biosynthesis
VAEPRVRIAFLTSEFITEANFAGGLAQHLGRVTRGLAERGHHVEVFVTAETCETMEDRGVIIRRVKLKKWLPLRSTNLMLRMIRKRPLCKLQLAYSTALGLDRALRRRSSTAGFDIVQATSWLGTGYFAAVNPWAPVVVRASSFEPLLFPHRGQRLSLDDTMYWRFEVAAMRRAAAVFSPSRFLAKEIRRITGVQSHVVNPPCGDAESTARQQAGDDPLADWSDFMIYFGKVAKYKGAGLLAEAVSRVLAQGHPLRLAVAGPVEDDPEARRLLSLAETRPASVRYLGSLNHDALMGVVERARCVVLPSLMDNLPNTCLEAMAMCKVVVGPNGVSFDELIRDGESGLLFRMGDPVSLRQAIVEAWDMSGERRRAMGHAAEARIRRMAPDIALRELERFYEGVIDNAGPSNGGRRPARRALK